MIKFRLLVPAMVLLIFAGNFFVNAAKPTSETRFKDVILRLVRENRITQARVDAQINAFKSIPQAQKAEILANVAEEAEGFAKHVIEEAAKKLGWTPEEEVPTPAITPEPAPVVTPQAPVVPVAPPLPPRPVTPPTPVVEPVVAPEPEPVAPPLPPRPVTPPTPVVEPVVAPPAPVVTVATTKAKKEEKAKAYKLFGLKKDASQKEIAQRFRHLASTIYKNPEDFQVLVNAYDALRGKKVPDGKIKAITQGEEEPSEIEKLVKAADERLGKIEERVTKAIESIDPQNKKALKKEYDKQLNLATAEMAEANEFGPESLASAKKLEKLVDAVEKVANDIEAAAKPAEPEKKATSPVIPAPVIPAPVIPAPVIPAPVIPAPVIPAPVIPAPVIPAPVIPAPVITPAPVPGTDLAAEVDAFIKEHEDEWGDWNPGEKKAQLEKAFPDKKYKDIITAKIP